MENPISANQNCTISSPNYISDKLIHTPLELADGHGRRLRPMQTDFFRELSLFNAHLMLEPDRSRWAQFLPEYLRPDNLEDYLKQTKKPRLFGNNFWWALQESPGQGDYSTIFRQRDSNGRFTTASEKKVLSVSDGQKDLQSSKIPSQVIDHIQYSRDQLLQLRKVKTVSEDIVKIKHGIEVEFFGVKQKISNGSTTVGNGGSNSGLNRENGLTLKEKEEEEGISEKKRKRGMSDQKKAKKKMKERKKRAEKNRKLGVKRLKIQPIVKQKPVSHCRHYLHGRCYEGEKCKFSHDVVPLTKSKPCCHFSRQACMKGDECPFDHQLSKYPCNNYASTGYCVRGDNCLYSHKITPKQDSMPSLEATKPDTKSQNQCRNSDSVKQVKNPISFPFGGSANHKQANQSQLIESGSPASTVKSPAKAFTVDSTNPTKTPKGLTFLNTAMDEKTCQKPHLVIESGSPASAVKSPAKPFTVDSTKPTKTPKGLTFLNTGVDEKTCQKPGSGTVNNAINHSTGLVVSAGDKKESGDTNQKPSVVPFKFASLTSCSSPLLNRLDSAQEKSASSSGQRSLLATLGFASKYNSGMKKLPLINTPPASGTLQTELPIKDAGLAITSVTSDMSQKKPANPFEL